MTFQEELTADGGATPTAGKAKTEPAAKATEPKPEVAKPVDKKAASASSKPADAGAIATRAAAAQPAPPAAKPPDGNVAGGAFTLQLGASQSREDAERMVSRLREKGYAPYIVTAEVPGKGTYYRVRMGSFATREAAGRYLEDFRRETKTEAFVASTK